MDLKTLGLSFLSFAFVILYIVQKWDNYKLDERRKKEDTRYRGEIKKLEDNYQLKLKEVEAEKKIALKEVDVKRITLDKNFSEKNESSEYWRRLNDENRAYHFEKMSAMKDHVRKSYDILIKEADDLFLAGEYKNAELFCRACIQLKPEEEASLRLLKRIEAFRVVNKFGMAFVNIPKGEFKMGSIPSEKMRGADEESHKVTISANYFLMETEVTQEQWDAVMFSPKGELRSLTLINTPSLTKGLRLPVENVSYHEITSFIIKLNQAGVGRYRLPSEAEWEYAARANEKGAFGENESPEATAWYSRNSQKVTHAVRTKFPNSFGLYDMLGNVSEWVEDNYAVYPVEAVVDPKVSDSSGIRCFRGGSFKDSDSACRIANRNKAKEDFKDGHLGFRLVYQP